MVTRADAIGGVQIHVRDVASALLARGHEVRVVTGRRGPFTAVLRRAGVPAIECPALQRAAGPRGELPAIFALRRVIAAFRPDVVSTHSSKAGILGRLACAPGGPPCLFTAHGWAFAEGVPERQRFAYRQIERALAPLAARIVCVSEHDRQLGIAAGISPGRLVTIHNGMPDIPAALRAAPGRGDPIRVVMTARFDRQKDHATLLRAAAPVAGLHLDLVGDGPDLPAARDLANDLGLSERVRFLGHRDDVAAVLAHAHAFALVSHWEGFPRSTLEAMRAGLPAVVTDVGGSAEAIEDGLTGFVVPRENAARLEDRLRRVATDAALREQMGTAARLRYEAHFTFERMLDRTIEVYRAAARR